MKTVYLVLYLPITSEGKPRRDGRPNGYSVDIFSETLSDDVVLAKASADTYEDACAKLAKGLVRFAEIRRATGFSGPLVEWESTLLLAGEST